MSTAKEMSAEKETLRRVQDALFHLRKGLAPFVEARMKTVHGASWLHYASRPPALALTTRSTPTACSRP